MCALYPELLMDNSEPSFALTGVVPPVCDAEAGERIPRNPTRRPANPSRGNGASTLSQSEARQGFSVRKIRSVMTQLCCAIRSALDDERGTAEESLRRAAEILREMGETQATTRQEVRGGLSPGRSAK
jgi:hypothetical protein